MKTHQVIFLRLLQATLAASLVSIEPMCDETSNCGTRISRKLCLERDCCYIESSLRVNQCVHKHKPKDKKTNNDIDDYKPQPLRGDEVLPPEAHQISDQLSRNLKRLKLTGEKRLSIPQTIQVTNWLDDYLKYAARVGSQNFNWKMSHDGIFYADIKTDPVTFNSSFRLRSGAVVGVKPSEGFNWNETRALIFVEYLTLGKEEQSLKKEPRKIITNRDEKCQIEKEVMNSLTVVSAKAYDHKWNEHPVVLQFSFNDDSPFQANSDIGLRISCEFLNKSSRQWSSEGCSFQSGKCGCNYTSKFSAIFAAQSVPLKIKATELTDLQVVELIMAALASGCLLITLLSLIFVSRRRSKSYTSASARMKERTIIHINFVAAMVGLHLTRLVAEILYEDYVLCAVAVVFSRYFMLVGGMWMLIESFILHVNVIAKGLKHSKMGCYKFIAGWLVPAVIALTTAAVGFSTGSYIENQDAKNLCEDVIARRSRPSSSHCWLSTESNLIWSATGPLIGIFVINFFILGHTIVYVLWLSAQAEILKPAVKRSQNVHYIWHATKGIIVLFPILGIPWMVDFYVKTSHYRVNAIVRYTHVILNGLQGLSLFILYCGLSQETHKSIKRAASSTWKQHQLSRPSSGCKASLKKLRTKNVESRFAYNQQQHTNTSRLTNQRKTTRNIFHQPCYNAIQKPQSASFSTNSSFLHFKTKRNYCISPGDPVSGMPAPPNRRTPTDLIGAYNSKATEKDASISILPGVKPEPGEPAMISFSFDDGRQEQAIVPAFKTRWRRVSTQDFRRFSAIPEELRRDVDIESLVVENIENVKLCRASERKLRTVRNRETVKVDVHMNDVKMLNSIRSSRSRVYFENNLSAVMKDSSPRIKSDWPRNRRVRY